MQKFAKPILIAAGAAVALCALAVLGANLYLQSSGVQARIHEAASLAAGMPLRIQGTSFTPWSGVSVSGLTVTQHDGSAAPLLDVSSVSVGFRFLPLLGGKVVISDVLLTSPTVTSVQRPDGTWEQPERYRPESLPAGPDGGQTIKPAPVTAARPAAPRQPVEIERLRIRNGRSLSYDSKGVLVMALENITVNARIPAEGPATGEFKIHDTTFGGVVRPRKVTGHFSWENGTLDIPDIAAKWAGGELTGSFHLEPLPANRFSATLAASDVALSKLAEDAGIGGDGKKGKLFLKGKIGGTPGKQESFTGAAEARLQEARLQPLDFIRQIGDLLQVEELQMLQLKTAEASFTIRDQKVIADKMVLESENLVMDAEGTANFDGKLKLRARLHVNEKLRRESHGLIGNKFEKSDRDGYTQMPFTVSGSLSRPKTDLLDKLVGIRIGQDIGGLLKNLFRAPPKPQPDAGTPSAAGGQDGR